MKFIRHYLLAIQYFTRIPVTGRLAIWAGFDPSMLRASAAHLPGVGWLVGAVTAMLFFLFCAVLPDVSAGPWVAALISTAAGVMLTGGFHEDGLADLSDGLGGALERDRALEIMKDSRIGSYGAIALVMALLTKVALLGLLGQIDAFAASLGLFAAHVLSRLMPMAIMYTLPHVGDAPGSKSKPIAGGIEGRALLAGLVWWGLSLALVWWCAPGGSWAFGSALAVVGLLFMRSLLSRRLQGFTGDGLGATQQVCEIAFYLGLALSAGRL